MEVDVARAGRLAEHLVIISIHSINPSPQNGQRQQSGRERLMLIHTQKDEKSNIH